MVGHGGSSAGSYLADPTCPIPSHCASIVSTSTLRDNIAANHCTCELQYIWHECVCNWMPVINTICILQRKLHSLLSLFVKNNTYVLQYCICAFQSRLFVITDSCFSTRIPRGCFSTLTWHVVYGDRSAICSNYLEVFRKELNSGSRTGYTKSRWPSG